MVGLIASREDELKALCERCRVERLAVFGSALRGDFSSKSRAGGSCVGGEPPRWRHPARIGERWYVISDGALLGNVVGPLHSLLSGLVTKLPASSSDRRSHVIPECRISLEQRRWANGLRLKLQLSTCW